MKSHITNFAGEVKYTWDPLKIYEVIDFIKWRPGFTVNGHLTIDALVLYLSGYQDGLSHTGLLDYGIPDFSHFSTWLCGQTRERALSAGWGYHILNRARQDQHKAFNLFFELLDKYKHSSIQAQQITLTSGHQEVTAASGVVRHIVYPVQNSSEALVSVPSKIVVFKIENSSSRWTVFFDEHNQNIYDNFTDKASEAYNQIIKEFGVTRSQLRTLSKEQSLDLYKQAFKQRPDMPSMTITHTPI